MTEKMTRSVFFLSDGTGITAESLGRSLLTQYDNFDFKPTSWPFLDSTDKAREAVEHIDRIAETEGARPLLFSTLVDPQVREVFRASKGLLIDFFETFNPTLEAELAEKATAVRGRSHGMGNYATYTARIDALNFALANDDGITVANYPAAEIILLGVSRSGKTPTSLYLALQYGILAANYPLTEDDFETGRLPKTLRPFKDKLFGLSIDAERLHQIRSERLPNSRYATRAQCQMELTAVERIYARDNVPFLNTTSMSIEEICTTIMQKTKLKRRVFA